MDTTPFAKPVRRPELVQSFLTVDLFSKECGSGNQIFDVIVRLIHGANYNDPQKFVVRDYKQTKSSQFVGLPVF
jgi:cyanobactin biosynthesis protein (PatB/AcyB/McaB family)